VVCVWLVVGVLVVAVHCGRGGVVHMVGDIVVGGGLVRCSGGCGVVGVSSVFRAYLLPLKFPSAAIQAIGPAKVCFPLVVQSSLHFSQSSYPLCL
jgi:hypothetical protein